MNECVFRAFVIRLKFFFAKTYILAILSISNYLLDKINIIFKKKFRYAIIIKQDKNVMSYKNEIYV